MAQWLLASQEGLSSSQLFGWLVRWLVGCFTGLPFDRSFSYIATLNSLKRFKIKMAKWFSGFLVSILQELFKRRLFFLLRAFKLHVVNLNAYLMVGTSRSMCFTLYITLTKLQFMMKLVSRWDVFNFNSWTYHICEYWLKNVNCMLWYVYPKTVLMSRHNNLTMASRSKIMLCDQTKCIILSMLGVLWKQNIWFENILSDLK